jgi:hypothetical protein
MTLRGYGADDERRRLRTGLTVLMAALVVLLAAVGMALLRSPSPTGDHAAPVEHIGASDEGPLASPAIDLAVPVLAVLAILLVVTLLVVSYAVFRLTQKLALPEEPPRKEGPTASDDVWRMHRLPDESPDGPEPPPPHTGN